MEYDVGSIVYIIDAKNRGIIPAQVNEQLTSKTVAGECVTHNIELPNGKAIKLESLDTAFFCSLDEVRAYLLEKATEIIDKGIMHAQKVVKTQFTKDESSFTHELQQSQTQDKVKVTLDDGTEVSVNVPPEFLSEDINH
jgi:DNA-binding transcriptional regulator/RsmH inhibitor MraZ